VSENLVILVALGCVAALTAVIVLLVRTLRAGGTAIAVIAAMLLLALALILAAMTGSDVFAYAALGLFAVAIVLAWAFKIAAWTARGRREEDAA
jgi:hypothetical protein